VWASRILEAALEAEAGVAFQATAGEGTQICQSSLQYTQMFMSVACYRYFGKKLFVSYSGLKQAQQNAGVDG